MKVKFGDIDTVQVIDTEGSTIETHEAIADGVTKLPIRKTYKVRIRVRDQKEEHIEYAKFSDEVNGGKYILDPCFYIERSKLGDKTGFYYIVKVYSILEYSKI